MTRLRAALVIFVMAVAAAVVVPAAPAHAVSTSWRVAATYNQISAAGNFVWLNQSVQVGGELFVDSSGFGGAVVITAYDGSGRQVARAVRPKDGEYYRTQGYHGFGFVLDPIGSPRGGIQRIEVDLWLHLPGSSPRLADIEHYDRP